MEPAATIIELCGGASAVAEMLTRDSSRVHRWTYSKEKGGTGGRIPAELQEKLLTEARARGINLRPEHFFPTYVATLPVDSAPKEEGKAA